MLLLTGTAGSAADAPVQAGPPIPSRSPTPQPTASRTPTSAAIGPVPRWTTVWSAAPGAALSTTATTFRNVIRTTAGGDGIRVHLSNRFGSGPVRLGHVTVALPAYRGKKLDGTARAGTIRTVLFGGRDAVTVPAGRDVVSDRLELSVAARQDLLVSVWTPAPSEGVTYHPRAVQKSFLSRARGDHAADRSAAAFDEVSTLWHYVTAVDVAGDAGTIVALGDSITDGIRSGVGANARYTDYLAARLGYRRGVANAGLSGNRVTLDAYWPKYTVRQPSGPRALTRAGRDAFALPGARTVIILLGINDIQQWPHRPAAAITVSLAQLCAQARARGLRVVVGTLTPWYGWTSWTGERERTRQAVNAWIRAGVGGAFDAVADFDAAVRDPARPQRLRPAFDSGDGLHPNAAGDEALAAAVPLDQL